MIRTPSAYCFTMTQNVSVPEKTLEHWASLCVAYRYRSLAAQWWPVNGVDIDLRALPAQPGKAIQLELKTITPAGPGRHQVNVDLGQLWEYSRKPLARQPFYAFPRPHWDGELAAAARADGQDATELAVQRSKTGWWFGDWMVVMTTQQVAGVLRQDLNAHRRRDRGVKRCLVQFDISDPDKPEWGDPASSVPPSEVLGWSRFWPELDECGRDEWPQLIRVPRLVLGRRRKSRHRDEEEELYPRHELAGMFRQSEQLPAELRGGALELETLEPDGNGNFRVAPGYAADIAGPDPSDDDRASEPEDRRQVVFINSGAAGSAVARLVGHGGPLPLASKKLVSVFPVPRLCTQNWRPVGSTDANDTAMACQAVLEERCT